MLEPSSYGFRNDDESILTLDSLGWQKIKQSFSESDTASIRFLPS